MELLLVSHTHWDREWYRSFQAFRARLVDAIDALLDLCQADRGYRFVLDGQSILLEDYLEIRPRRQSDLEAFIRGGQIAVGPWYVQPDSLLPSGESHVRNLLEGRGVAERFGPPSTVAYTPDSFGHPAQLPQILRGFGLEAFVYWRGNGNESDALPSEYVWEAPDGSAIVACHLALGYFAAAQLGTDPEEAAARLERLGRRLAARAVSDAVLLMNGMDHQPPEPATRAVAEALAKRTGGPVHRARLEDFVARLPRDLPRYRGELLGARSANLLPGVWSTRTWLKQHNRSCESELQGWTEPFAALGRSLGRPDERPSLSAAWRTLLGNQAHDSICGCSQDYVHAQMLARYLECEDLARETTQRLLDGLAGYGGLRETPWTTELELAVFNPSPHTRSDVVRLPLDPTTALRPDIVDLERTALHPLLVHGARGGGYTLDGVPVRVATVEDPARYRFLQQHPPLELEFVVKDVPAFGWKRLRLKPIERTPDRWDEGRRIDSEEASVHVGDDGTLDVRLGECEFQGLCVFEDLGDRGDSYDFEPVSGGTIGRENLRVRRLVDAGGLQRLEIRLALRVPAQLDESRQRRSKETVVLPVRIDAQIVPGLRRIDLRVQLSNTARDHRLRLLFPTGQTADRFLAATSFDICERRTGVADTRDWVHPPPNTFPHQGWIHCNGLTVVAPGLPEGEVCPAGTIAVTLLRAVGWLSRGDLTRRPLPAGPAIPLPGAQCLGPLEARLWLLEGVQPRAALDAELGLRAALAGTSPPLPPGTPLLSLEPEGLLLSALKPAEKDAGELIVRVLNPTDEPLTARLRLGLPVRAAHAVRLDETDQGEPPEVTDAGVRFVLPPHALRSLALRLGRKSA
ncbi:MAG: glycosyl hydrolase-related protein [Myxococcota bacterium]